MRATATMQLSSAGHERSSRFHLTGFGDSANRRKDEQLALGCPNAHPLATRRHRRPGPTHFGGWGEPEVHAVGQVRSDLAIFDVASLANRALRSALACNHDGRVQLGCNSSCQYAPTPPCSFYPRAANTRRVSNALAVIRSGLVARLARHGWTQAERLFPSEATVENHRVRGARLRR
jgi:hypothetical protein